MRSSSLLAVPDKSRNPQSSKTIQKIVLALSQVLTDEYGARTVPLSVFTQLIGDSATKIGAEPLVEPELRLYLALMSDRIGSKTNNFHVAGESVSLEPLIIEWDDFDPTVIRNLVFERFPVRPNGFAERLSLAESRLRAYLDNIILLRFTSPILNQVEIHDAIAKVINSAKTKLYAMVAFFGEELKFFPEFIGAVGKVSDLDVRILIRDPTPDAPGNKELISAIRKNFSDRDVVRIYGSDFIVGSGGRIGHLHSKMLLSDQFLLVGSANLTAWSLASNEESAVFTNHPDLVSKAHDHFLSIWNQFRPLGGNEF